MQISYPDESFFYPYHLVIAFVTSVIFLIIVLSYRHYLVRRAGAPYTPPPDTPKVDAIALGSLVASIAITGILPILLSPLLDYSVSILDNNTKLTIQIENLGLASAKNIISSVSAKNVTFSNFESEPFLANHFITNSSILGHGFFEVNLLPPRSETIVNAMLDSSKADQKQKMIVYVRSDERVGFHDTIITSIFYLSLGIIYVMLFIYLVYWDRVAGSPSWKKLNMRRMREVAFYVILIGLGEGVVTLLYYLLYYPLVIPNLPVV